MLSLSGGGGEEGGLTKLKTWYLPTEHVNHVKKLVVRHLRIFHHTPCLLSPPHSPRKFCKTFVFFLFFFSFLLVFKLSQEKLKTIMQTRNVPPHKVFHDLWFLFLLSISVFPGEIEDN